MFLFQEVLGLVDFVGFFWQYWFEVVGLRMLVVICFCVCGLGFELEVFLRGFFVGKEEFFLLVYGEGFVDGLYVGFWVMNRDQKLRKKVYQVVKCNFCVEVKRRQEAVGSGISRRSSFLGRSSFEEQRAVRGEVGCIYVCVLYCGLFFVVVKYVVKLVFRKSIYLVLLREI